MPLKARGCLCPGGTWGISPGQVSVNEMSKERLMLRVCNHRSLHAKKLHAVQSNKENYCISTYDQGRE